MATTRSYPALRPRSIVLAAAILEFLESAKRREPLLDNDEILEALQLTREEVVFATEQHEWN